LYLCIQLRPTRLQGSGEESGLRYQAHGLDIAG